MAERNVSPPPLPLEYETPPMGRRVVTIPRRVYALHRAVLEHVEIVSILYGIALMTAGYLFRMMGIAFVVGPKQPHRVRPGGPR